MASASDRRALADFKRQMAVAERMYEWTERLVDAAAEQAMLRGWNCPDHGPRERRVDGEHRCLVRVSKTSRCLQVCAQGDLIYAPKEIGAVASHFVRTNATREVVHEALGLTKRPQLPAPKEVHNHLHLTVDDLKLLPAEWQEKLEKQLVARATNTLAAPTEAGRV